MTAGESREEAIVCSQCVNYDSKCTDAYMYISQLFIFQVFSESVMSVDGGLVGSSNHEEVVIATYSGRVLGLVREMGAQQPISQETQAKIEALR